LVLERESELDIVFMGTPDFAVDILQKLIQEPFVNLKLVVTQPDNLLGEKEY